MAPKNKKVPVRKCVGCQENITKKELIRIVNNKELGVVLDKTGKLNGRGAYLCCDSDCVDLAIKKRRLNSALKSEIPEDLYKEIKDYVKSKTD